jgi:uncharacterized membrane protein YagU involved in acid resistance
MGQPTAAWKVWVDASPIRALLLIGLIATQIATYFGYVFEAFGLPQLGWNHYNGFVVLREPMAFGFEASAADLFWTGAALHMVNGVVFTVLYGVIARPMMPFKNDANGDLMAGVTYGLILTIISLGVLVPYAYVPEQGYGFFMFDGPDGWKLPAANLIWHLLYGALVGTLWQPGSSRDASSA